jgi:hypothetical protein
MRKNTAKSIILTVVLTIGIIACKTSVDPFGDLVKLEGHWEMKFESGESTVEIWEKVNDTLFTGRSYEVAGGDSTLTERLQLVNRNGEILYIPTVTDQNEGKPVIFKLTKSEGSSFTFENPEHDFPNTIKYVFHGNDSLTATISGPFKEVVRELEFDYIRLRK